MPRRSRNKQIGSWNVVGQAKPAKVEPIEELSPQKEKELESDQVDLEPKSLNYHPYYYEAKAYDEEDFPEFSWCDYEQWALKDWETFDIEIENSLEDWRVFDNYRRQWFLYHYGDTFRPHKVLYYDFERYRSDVQSFFAHLRELR